MPRYWINTISRDHVVRGIEGGFTQANHGRSTTLRRLARGDLVVFYSPRTHYPDGPPLQRFTAVGRVIDDDPYQIELTATFHPWRRRMEFLACQEVSVKELVAKLSFIPDPRRWGFPFRRGLFEISATDFQGIALAMKVDMKGDGGDS